ncbi:hypothetical protein [Streptomyces katrae]|uniref:hypothetical protein n=1 Tax=Streptomyces katrae TaxID=68223 RepID=UPI00131DC7A6|nr:hypothetical protein [Streptomyces katrae]
MTDIKPAPHKYTDDFEARAAAETQAALQRDLAELQYRRKTQATIATGALTLGVVIILAPSYVSTNSKTSSLPDWALPVIATSGLILLGATIAATVLRDQRKAAARQKKPNASTRRYTICESGWNSPVWSTSTASCWTNTTARSERRDGAAEGKRVPTPGQGWLHNTKPRRLTGAAAYASRALAGTAFHPQPAEHPPTALRPPAHPAAPSGPAPSPRSTAWGEARVPIRQRTP